MCKENYVIIVDPKIISRGFEQFGFIHHSQAWLT